MNLKFRSDSIIAGFSEEKRRLVDQWLSVENISYGEAAARSLKHLGRKISSQSFLRYHRRCIAERVIEKIAASAHSASALANHLKDDKFPEGLSLVVGQLAFESALAISDKLPYPAAQPNPESQAETDNTASKEKPRRSKTEEDLYKRAAVYADAMKIVFDKQSMALETEKHQLELRKYKDHVAAQKAKIDAAVAKSQEKPGISPEVMAQIEAAAKLL